MEMNEGGICVSSNFQTKAQLEPGGKNREQVDGIHS